MVAWQVTIAALSIAALLTAYGLYFNALRQATIHPSKASWLIWSASSLLETITFSFITTDFLKIIVFATSTGACLIITIKIWWSNGTTEISRTDRWIILICLLSISIWVFSGQPQLAHFVILASVPLAFYPTVREIILNPFAEQPTSWLLWLISDVLSCMLIILRLEEINELPFVILELICHGTVWASIVATRSIVIEKDNAFVIGTNHLGKAVYAKRKFKAGQFIMLFHGDVLSSSQINEQGISRHYIIQVGIDKYLGPSGLADDFVNHSCDPNAGIVISNETVYLFTIKPIEIGDEITWDYASTSTEDLNMVCNCNTASCRKIISNFDALPKLTKQLYIYLGIVPKYLSN